MSIKSLANLRLSSVSTFDNNRQEISTMARGEESLSEKLLSVAPNATSSIAKYYRDKRSFYKSKPTLLLGKTLIKVSFESFFVGDKNKIVHVIKLAGRELSLKTWEHKCIKTFSDSASAGAGKANLKVWLNKFNLYFTLILSHILAHRRQEVGSTK